MVSEAQALKNSVDRYRDGEEGYLGGVVGGEKKSVFLCMRCLFWCCYKAQWVRPLLRNQ